MKIINKPYMEFNKEEQSRLRYMTLCPGSFMKSNMRDNPEGIDTFVATDKDGDIDEFLSWAMVVGWLPEWKLFMVYTHPLYRLKGIATLLAKKARKKYKNIGMVRGFDGEEFVDKLSKKIKLHVVEEL